MALQNCAIETMNTFMNNVFYIPSYQRDYSWQVEELTDLWLDLESTKNNEDEQKHFFGLVVIHNDEKSKRKYIIDGQQRTVTAEIFMRVLQLHYERIYKETNSNEAMFKMSDISSIFLGRYTNKKNELHLTLSDLDNTYFKDNIILGTPEKCPKSKKFSQELMRKAFVFFNKKIEEILEGIDDTEDAVDVLTEYYDAFVTRFNVLYLEATKLEEAFISFETLNARGEDLETADLLKNHIFSKCKDIESAITKWNSMINGLDKADPTKYIRHFWNSRNAFVREKNLYREIRENLNSPRECKEFLKDLEKFAQYYHDMTNPCDTCGFTDERLVKSLKAIKVLKASSFYPIVLAMLQMNYKESEIRDVVETIEVYVFRNFTVCGKVANSAEIFFNDVARKIYNETFETIDEIILYIRHGIVSDKEFQDAFEQWSSTKSGKETVRYILRKVHKYLDRANEINVDNSEVHIEHIMPEDVSMWEVSEEVHETYLWRLGNLALLSGAYNRAISNKPFVEKKEKYDQSKIEPNKQIAECEVWTENEIENRQKQLCKYAMKIWKR